MTILNPQCTPQYSPSHPAASLFAFRSGGSLHRSGATLLLAALFADADRLIRRDYPNADLTPGEIARRLRCSRATLYRAFRARNLTVAGYLRQVRLEEVCLQLCTATARVPISTVALNCGFECLRAFNRTFKAEYGMTAGRYRREIAGSTFAQSPALSTRTSLLPGSLRASQASVSTAAQSAL